MGPEVQDDHGSVVSDVYIILLVYVKAKAPEKEEK